MFGLRFTFHHRRSNLPGKHHLLEQVVNQVQIVFHFLYRTIYILVIIFQVHQLESCIIQISRRNPVAEMIQYLFAFKQLLERHFEEIARIITTENGKTLAEAELALGPRVVRGHRHLLIRPEAVLGVRAGDSGRLLVRLAGGVELEVSRGAAPALKARLGLT